MKWIVFALGFILGLGGLFALSQGYDSMQPERSFTLAISGVTALGAGIVTIALGFIVVRLETLIRLSAPDDGTAFREDRALVDSVATPDRAPPAEAAGLTDADPASEAPESAPPAIREQPAEPQDGLPQQANESDFSLESLGFRPPPPSATDETVAEAEDSGTLSPVSRRRPSFSLPPRPAKKSIPIPGLWPSERASVAAEPEGPAQAEPPPSAEEHDWLERALAGVEAETSATAKPQDDETRTAAPKQRSLGSLPLRRQADETPRKAEPNPLPGDEPGAPSVVGRYESNGASYALFADGSIEAETDSGTYHFKSLAELKTFIENRVSS